MSETRSPEELLDAVVEASRSLADALRPGGGEYKLRKLLEIAEWARAQQAHQPGDCVVLDHVIDFGRSHGWRPYAVDLSVGAVGVVTDLHFSGGWMATVAINGNQFNMPVEWLIKSEERVCGECGRVTA